MTYPDEVFCENCGNMYTQDMLAFCPKCGKCFACDDQHDFDPAPEQIKTMADKSHG